MDESASSESQRFACSVIASRNDEQPTIIHAGNSDGSVIFLESDFVKCTPITEVLNPTHSDVEMLSDISLAVSDDCYHDKMWSQPVTSDESVTECSVKTSKFGDTPRQRHRRAARPYSPEHMVPNKKLRYKKKQNLQSHLTLSKGSMSSSISNDKPFCCDMCKSPYIVNPTRSRLRSTKAKRKPVARKVIDTIKQKVLVVCNACGLSVNRNQTKKPKKVPPTAEEKSTYLKEAISFAKALADSLQEPLVERLYCPVFKLSKPCRCLQNHIMGNYDVDNENGCIQRTLQLLTYLREAQSLIKVKDFPDSPNNKSGSNKKIKVKFPRGAKIRRSQAFEKFVLSKRIYLRDELGLCERGSQRVLMYSNNFLHKYSKSGFNKAPRVEKTIGKNAAGSLKPISELANKPCCLDSCMVLASTHSKLLETWRETARLGQRQARRVLAEMLTPTGGTKANCYKFISMVTGCSYATISLVSEHMKRTQGDREPPEHGLKKWWRNKARDEPPEHSEDEDGLLLPLQSEQQAMDSQGAHSQLQHQRQKLERTQKRLVDQQVQLEKQQMLLNEKASSTDDCRSIDPKINIGYNDPKGHTKMMPSSQMLHILKLPNSSSLATIPTARQVMSPPTISVMTSNGSFEPLGNISNISVSLPGTSSDQATFRNVVIVPVESPLDVSGLGTRTFTESPVPMASYEVDVSSTPGMLPATSSTYQLFTVMDAPGNTMFQLN